jgi:ribonuclease T2
MVTRFLTLLRVLAIGSIGLLATAGAPPIASARHRHQSSDAAAGVFDYYLLSLSWSPAFCLESPRAAQCSGPRRYGFVVHGLWPQYERGWPEHCARAAQVPDSVARGIADLMPSRGLVEHEWSAHGTCSGLEPAEFFALVRRAYRGVVIPAAFENPSAPIEQTPFAIAAEFLQVNPHLPPQSVVATCTKQETPRLREVHLCFTPDLKPRACSADALREACHAPSVIVPPIR